MAEKKLDEKEKFEAEVYKLGLEMIESLRTGTCRDYHKTLEAVIGIFKITRAADEKGR